MEIDFQALLINMHTHKSASIHQGAIVALLNKTISFSVYILPPPYLFRLRQHFNRNIVFKLAIKIGWSGGFPGNLDVPNKQCTRTHTYKSSYWAMANEVEFGVESVFKTFEWTNFQISCLQQLLVDRDFHHLGHFALQKLLQLLFRLCNLPITAIKHRLLSRVM